MGLSNTALRYYDSNVLRLPADKRKKYHEQVDRLIAELCKKVRDKTEIKITKVVKAGSFAKFTILRKTSVDPVDVDVVFYISGRDASRETLDSLNDLIYDLLLNIYPNKAVEDFQIQRKAATVSFVGRGSASTSCPSSRTSRGPAMVGSSTFMTGRRSRPAHRARSSSCATARTRTQISELWYAWRRSGATTPASRT